MDKKFWISGFAISILALLLDFIIHGLLLSPDYMAQAQLYRSEADQSGHAMWMIIAHLFYGFGLTWIYQRGVSAAPPMGQGLRFGLAVGLTFAVSNYLIYYAVQPLPGVLVGKQIIFEIIANCILGVALAFLNKSARHLNS
jgi:hypothetical protein